jgi:hypothetical protein
VTAFFGFVGGNQLKLEALVSVFVILLIGILEIVAL